MEPLHRQLVSVDGRVMDPQGVLIRALFDPGLFVKRLGFACGHGCEPEPLHRWQARAVLVALELAGHSITPAEGARPTPERNYV